MPLSVHKVIVPMAVVLPVLHRPRSAHRPYAPSARMKYIIVQAADVRAAAGRLARPIRQHHEVFANGLAITACPEPASKTDPPKVAKIRMKIL
jgi:hypothetical protein